MSKFDLHKVPIYVQCNPNAQKRIDHIKKMAIDNKLNITFIKGPSHDKLVRYENGAIGHANVVLEHLKRCKDGFVPFLSIEDDVSINMEADTSFDVPLDADAVYIGLCLYSVHPLKDCKLSSKFTCNVEGYPHLLKDLNMLGTHGVYFNSLRYAAHYAQTCLQNMYYKIPAWDIPMARDKALFNVYCLKKSLVYQDKKMGGQEKETYITHEKTLEPDVYEFFKLQFKDYYFNDVIEEIKH